MKRAALILTIGLLVAYGISRLPVEQITVIGYVWGAVFKVFAYAVLAASIVTLLTAKRQ